MIPPTKLIEGCKLLGLCLTLEQVQQFNKYAELLSEVNKKTNLTRITEQDTTEMHFLDSLLCCQAVDLTKVEKLLDVGTGAGFPGLVLKIAFPHLFVTLLDSNRKKIGFLDYCCSRLNLTGIKTVHAKATDPACQESLYKKFDLVTARAVANLTDLAKILLSFLGPDGVAVALKSENIDDELKSCQETLATLNARISRVVSSTIPNTSIVRKLVVLNHIIKKQ